MYQIKSGGAASILREDAGQSGELLFSLLYNPWRAVVQLVTGLVVLAWVDWRFLLGAMTLVPALAWTEPPANNFIDRHIAAKLRSIQVLPSDLCTDAEFLRRVYLDLTGLPPTADEVRAFMAETSPPREKRNAVIVFELHFCADLEVVSPFACPLKRRIVHILLHRRGYFRIEAWLASRLARQLAAAVAMVAALIGIRMVLESWFSGSLGHRLAGVIAVVGGGMIVYFPLVWMLGGTDREAFKSLLKRRRPYTDAG